MKAWWQPFPFFWETLKALPHRQWPKGAVIDQMYRVGVGSVSTVIFTGAFVGAIMAVQVSLELRDFGAQGFLGGLTTSVTIRNVGPVLIAFLLAGKVGAYTSAELGNMRVTDQIEAIRCLGISPIGFLIAPRFLAVVLSAFCLLMIGLVFTLLGGLGISASQLGVNTLYFLREVPRFVTLPSFAMALVKSFVFGVLIAWVSCYRGYYTTGGSAGVGASVRRTSVECLVLILIADYVTSFLFNRLCEAMGWGGIAL